MSNKAWLSEVSICDMCGKKFGKHFYDAKVSGSSWGLICEKCFKAHNCSLGIGYGQKYLTKTREGVAGFEESNKCSCGNSLSIGGDGVLCDKCWGIFENDNG